MEAKIAHSEVSMIAQPRDQVASFESTVLYVFVTLSDLAPQDSEDTASCARRPPTHQKSQEMRRLLRCASSQRRA